MGAPREQHIKEEAHDQIKLRLDRRKFLVGSAAPWPRPVGAPAIIRAADRELRMLTWEGYAEPEWLDRLQAGDRRHREHRLCRLGR